MTPTPSHGLRPASASTPRVFLSRRKAQAMHASARLLHRVIDRFDHDVIVILGMRRAGNHAFINWLLAQTPTACVFYNNVKRDDVPYERWRREFRLRRPRIRPRVIFSYEDLTLEDVMSGPLSEFLARHEGRGQVRIVVMMREARNIFASRLKKWPERFAGPADIARDKRLYLDLGRLARDRPALQGGGRPTAVLFDRFIADPAFRERLSDELGIARGDRGLDQVTTYGHGSSFDGTAFSGSATDMSVLRRHEAFADDPRFRELTEDPEIVAMSEALFGPSR